MDKRVKDAVKMTDLTLDQWRPITNEEFPRRLSEACFFDGEVFTPPVVECIDLEKGTAIVFRTMNGFDDKNVKLMEPELLILELPNDVEGDGHKVSCFVHN